MADINGFDAPLSRMYIDTRAYLRDNGPTKAQTVDLPLIETLPSDVQTAIRRYLRAADRIMSLASALLKYQFIHQTAKIPWTEVQVARTASPHMRPYWDPPQGWQGDGFEGLEFNVSHQAGVVVIVGCKVSERPDHQAIVDGGGASTHTVNANTESQSQGTRIGVDVACTKEPKRTPDLSTQAKLNQWVDTFSEMFSLREMNNMKNDPIGIGGDDEDDGTDWNWEVRVLEQKARRFYAYWALKEAYIKMIGTGLLANWLTRLEFINVLPPKPDEKFRAGDIGMQVLFGGQDITDTIDVQVEAFDTTFLIVTMTKGIKEDDECERSWRKIDIEKDVRACAEGRCMCLD